MTKRAVIKRVKKAVKEKGVDEEAIQLASESGIRLKEALIYVKAQRRKENRRKAIKNIFVGTYKAAQKIGDGVAEQQRRQRESERKRRSRFTSSMIRR